MLSAASKVTGGEAHGTREKPTARASCKQGFDGSLCTTQPLFAYRPSNARGVKGDKQVL